MTPSPGRIHQLPVKIHYSLEGGNQSYLTVLDGKQDVFVHPGLPTYGTDDEPGPIGSTYLKSIAQGVCYASPECVPSSSSLDFSVYNLDPTPRSRPTSQPFASSSTAPIPLTGDDQSWSGKGFLSWAMSEPSNGTTLVKGRLMKEYDFEPSRFSQEGGLEALMRAGNGGDGRGWGLEVVISLKLVNPGGKGEFSGRREFERMLFSGNGQASGSVLVPSPSRPSPGVGVRPTPAGQAQAQIPTYHNGPAQTRTIPQGQMQNGDMRAGGNSNGRTPPVAAVPRVIPVHPSPNVGRPPIPASRSSASSLPPSSIPMGQTSSQSGPSGQSRPSSSMAGARQPYRPPPPAQQQQQQQQSSSTSTSTIQRQPNLPPHPSSSASNHPPSDHASSSNHPSSTSNRSATPKKQPQSQPVPPPPKSMNRNSRQVTPPPLPRPKSPPPTTPHRRALRDLLQADGKMSPSLAKELVNNPSLMALLKSIPSTGAQQRSDQHGQGTSHGNGDGNGQGGGGGGSKGGKGKGNRNEDGRSARDETPTPTGPKTAAGGVGIPGGCSNCGTTETTLWRSKVYPDGTQTKVCDDCGVYFNKNKRMRPKELWETSSHGESSKRARTSTAHPTPPPNSGGIPTGVRHSPRLSRTGNANSTASGSGAPPPAQGHGSPTRSTGHGHGHGAPSLPAAQESPSKRRRSKPVPQPSPRMATRSSARTDTDAEGGSGSGHGTMEPFPFNSPSSRNHNHNHHNHNHTQNQDQSQSHSESQTQTGGQNQVDMAGMDEIDFEALLAQFTNPQPSNSNGSVSGSGAGGGGSGGGNGVLEGGINLEDLFASVDNAAATDDALAEDMMKFLAGLENDLEPGTGDENGNEAVSGEGRGQVQGQGTAGPSTDGGPGGAE